jgi:hypothetical protein
MALPYLEIRDTSNATIEYLEFGAILAGQVSDIQTIRIWNDYNSSFFSDPAYNSGLRVLDEDGEEDGDLVENCWLEYRVGETVDTADPSLIETSWKPLGKNNCAELSVLPSNTFRTVYLRLRAPAGVSSTSYTFHLSPFYGAQISYVDELLAELAGNGIVNYQGNDDISGFRWGYDVTALDLPTIAIAEGEALFSGDYLLTDLAIVTFDQLDGSSATLESGESYYTVISLKDDGTFTITKGDKDASPTVPDEPTGELKLAEVLVGYTSGDTAISDSNIDWQVEYAEFGGYVASSTSFEVGYGDALNGNKYIETSSKSDLTLNDNETNYIYLSEDGYLSCVTEEPTDGLMLYKVVMVSEVATVYDRRKFIEASGDRLVLEIENNSGSDLNKHDVVIWSGELVVSHATIAGDTKWAGVLLQDIPDGEKGWICHKGLVLANVSGATNPGDHLKTDETAGYLTAESSPSAYERVGIAQGTISSGAKKIYALL